MKPTKFEILKEFKAGEYACYIIKATFPSGSSWDIVKYFVDVRRDGVLEKREVFEDYFTALSKYYTKAESAARHGETLERVK